jgi:uncharacterized membrane protein
LNFRFFISLEKGKKPVDYPASRYPAADSRSQKSVDSPKFLRYDLGHISSDMITGPVTAPSILAMNTPASLGKVTGQGDNSSVNVRIFEVWEEIRSSYWFVPALMAGGSIVLAILMVAIDNAYQDEVVEVLGFLWTGGPEGARGLLETVAGSMITVAGVTFSITMVAFSQASSQFGPRLLRSFMSDVGNQIVLGTFVSTFIYSIMVLRTVRAGDSEFVPYVSVTLTIVFALASLGVLLYFIHHAAQMMQADYVVAAVAGDLFLTIDRLFPDRKGQEPHENGADETHPCLSDENPDEPDALKLCSNGYLQAVDEDGLLALAHENDLCLKILIRPGHFVTNGSTAAYIYPQGRAGEEIKLKMVKSFIVGRQRTHTQDIEFAIEQLVEVAVRSLSSGINDPITAITCIDWLGAALIHLDRKKISSPYRRDRNGALRLIMEKPFSYKGMIEASFNLIRQNGRNSIAIRLRLLETLARALEQIEDPIAREVLEEQIRLVERADSDYRFALEDQKDLRERVRAARKAAQNGIKNEGEGR